MSDRVARRRAETRRRIFTEAMRLFQERGFDNVTVADITEAADVAKGTFFTHFPTKRDVFRYIGAEALDALLAARSEAATVREKITRMLQAAVAWHEEHADLTRMMLTARTVSLATDFGSENQRALGGALVEILTAGVAAGELRADLPVVQAATLLQGAYFLTLIGWATDPEGPSLTERITTAVDLLFQGML